MSKHSENKGALSAQEKHVSQHGLENEVIRRYGDGAEQAEAGLCCPTTYEKEFLAILPDELIEKDYGCGNPSAHVREGETVVDLGSGGGKICYILAQKVGAEGRVIGVDFNDRMLNLARKYQGEMAEKLGYANVNFFKGKIQDLALDLDRLQGWLDENPVKSVDDAMELDQVCHRLRREEPMIDSGSVDVIVSNCVLNLVQPSDKKQLFREMNRVLRKGGRAVISDIVCDEDPTPAILADPELWSGCIAGAFREDEFLQMFLDAGFYGVRIIERQETPWQVIDGVEFRSLTVEAFKDEPAPALEKGHAVVYAGPWSQVEDDEGLIYHRGVRTAVSQQAFERLTDPTGPYAEHLSGIPPYEAVETAHPFPEDRKNSVRSPRETKGKDYRETQSAGDSCCDSGSCC